MKGLEKMSSHGEVGVFPALLDPARAIAKELTPGSQHELADYPGHWVAREGDLPQNASVITSFDEDDEKFVLYELTAD